MNTATDDLISHRLPWRVAEAAHNKAFPPNGALLTDFDLIGISYYGHQWSSFDIPGTGEVIKRVRKAYPTKDVMLVETAFPYDVDAPGMHSNLSGKAAMPGYPVTIEGQKKFLVDLTKTVLAAGGDGVNYWGPDLVPNSCATRNTGSRTSLFDLDGNVLPARRRSCATCR